MGRAPVVAEWLQTLVPSRDFWERAYAAHAGFTVMDLLASVLLLAFIRIGRPLYIETPVAGVVLYMAYPPSIPNLLGMTLGTIQSLLAGAIVCLMFVPEVSRRFQRHAGDTDESER